MPFCYWKSSNFVEKFGKIHVLNAVLMDNFAVHHKQLGVSEISALQGLIERSAL